MRDSQETKLLWPMTQDHAVLRMNMLSGLLDDVAYNHAHKVDDVALYESGRVLTNIVRTKFGLKKLNTLPELSRAISLIRCGITMSSRSTFSS